MLLILKFLDNKNVINITFVYPHTYLIVMNSAVDLRRTACEWVQISHNYDCLGL